jgi:hypothetical protein
MASAALAAVAGKIKSFLGSFQAPLPWKRAESGEKEQ